MNRRLSFPVLASCFALGLGACHSSEHAENADGESEADGSAGGPGGSDESTADERFDASQSSPSSSDAPSAKDGASDAAPGLKAFCAPENFRVSAKDGITDLPSLGLRIPVDSSNTTAPRGSAVTGFVQSQKLGKRIDYTLYVPASFDQAETLAFMVYSPTYEDLLVRRNFDRLIAGGEMPPTLVVFPQMDWTNASDATGDNIRLRAAFLADELFPHLKTTYPKLATQARWHGVGGQSTAGALAFDFAWARPDFFSKVSGDSTSFASFMRWLFPYDEKIDDSRKSQLRVSSTVGELDIGDWLATNKRVATTLLAKGYATRLLVIPKGQHSPGNWLPATLDDMRWLWRPEVCP